MQQSERYGPAQTASTAGNKSYFAAEFASHERLHLKFYTLIYTPESVEYSSAKERFLCPQTLLSTIV
jgi:hypothetical protein